MLLLFTKPAKTSIDVTIDADSVDSRLDARDNDLRGNSSFSPPMRQFSLVLATIMMLAPSGFTQQTGPYKVLKTARGGGEGSWDYIYADVAGRRLYIPRRGTPAAPEVQTRLSIYNLDTLDPIGEIAGVGGQGAAVDPKSGHGFTSSIQAFGLKQVAPAQPVPVISSFTANPTRHCVRDTPRLYRGQPLERLQV